ncbi:C-terminal binding protein [Nocardia sp. NPDC003963]
MRATSSGRGPAHTNGAGGTVAVVDAPSGGYVERLDLEQRVIGGAGAVTKYLIDPDSRDALLDIRDPYLILWHHVGLDREFFERSAHCRAVICASVGYNHVDIRAAADAGIDVYHIPQYGTEEVADHTLALFLAAWRRLPDSAGHVRDGGWDWRTITGIRRLRGATWGVVGLGRVGLAVAARAAAFGMRITFHDPYAHPGIEKSLGLLRRPTLRELLSDSDVVSLHTPLNEETHHLLGTRELQWMTPGSTLVNTARGALVDIDALREALSTGRPGVAALDVVEGEPQLPAWIRSDPRVLLSPHSAFYSREALDELRTRAAGAARQLLEGVTVTEAVPVHTAISTRRGESACP